MIIAAQAIIGRASPPTAAIGFTTSSKNIILSPSILKIYYYKPNEKARKIAYRAIFQTLFHVACI